jgi:mannosyltransferase
MSSAAISPRSAPRVAWRWSAGPELWALVLVVLAGFFLRFHDLGVQGFWLDEAFTWSAVVASWRDTWAVMMQFSDVSPLSYVVYKLAAPLLGLTEFALRTPSGLVGLLAVPVVYRVGRAMLGKWEGVVAAAVVALSPFAIWHARDARPYSFYLLFSALALWGFWRAVQGRGWWLQILASLAFYLTHYVAALYAYVQAVYCLLQLRRQPLLFRKWFFAQVIAGLPTAAWLLAFLVQRRLLSANWWIPRPTLLTPLQTLWNFFTGDATRWTVVMGVGVVGLVGLMIFGVRRYWPAPAAQLLLAWLLLPPLTAWLFSLRLPSYVDRYFEPSLLAVALFLAAGVVGLPRFWRPVALTVVGAVLVLSTVRLYSDPIFAKQDWRGVARALETDPAWKDLPIGFTDPQPLLSLSPYMPVEELSQRARVMPTQADLNRLWTEAQTNGGSGAFLVPMSNPAKNESAHNLSKPTPFDPLTEGPDFLVKWLADHPEVPRQGRLFAGVAVVRVGP